MIKKFLLYFLLPLLAVGFVFVGLQYQPDIPAEVIKEKYASEASQFASFNGLEVHYRDEGAGVPLILLHGTGASLHTWDGWVAALSDSFRCIRLDLPAFGLTGPNASHDYSMPAYVKFLDSFLQKLAIDSCYIAGNSLGGRISWEYVLAHPGVVKKMILIDAAGFPNDKIPPAFRLAQNPLAKYIVRYIGARSLVEKSLLEVYADDAKVTDALVDRYYELALREGNRDAFIARANTHFADNVSEIRNIEVPVLVLWGAQDSWTPVDDAYRFQEALPNSELVILEDAGHIPMEEMPERTAALAKTFLLR